MLLACRFPGSNDPESDPAFPVACRFLSTELNVFHTSAKLTDGHFLPRLASRTPVDVRE